MMFRTGWQHKAECLKELSDLVYVCYQYAVNQGWDLDEALDRVHKSNMSKLDEDGKPIFRKDDLKVVGYIGMVKSTNHRFRVITIFERL